MNGVNATKRFMVGSVVLAGGGVFKTRPLRPIRPHPNDSEL